MARLLLLAFTLSGCTAVLAEREIARSEHTLVALDPQLSVYSRTLAHDRLASAREEALQGNYRAAAEIAKQAIDQAKAHAEPAR